MSRGISALLSNNQSCTLPENLSITIAKFIFSFWTCIESILEVNVDEPWALFIFEALVILAYLLVIQLNNQKQKIKKKLTMWYEIRRVVFILLIMRSGSFLVHNQSYSWSKSAPVSKNPIWRGVGSRGYRNWNGGGRSHVRVWWRNIETLGQCLWP